MSATKEITAGIIGGLAGGLVMAALMLAGRRAGLIATPPPVPGEHPRAGGANRTGAAQVTALGLGLHMLLSATFGAGYGALHVVLDLPAIPGGLLYGLGIYALNFVGFAPAFGIMPVKRPMALGHRVLLHAVYGTVTALVSERVRQ